MPDSLAGTGALLRLALRRDRWLLPAWIVGFAAMAGISSAATADLYPEVPARVQAAEVINATPSLVALYGRIYDPTSLGALSLIKLTAFGAAMAAILMGVITVRHTRAEEAENRLDLLSAGVLGRDAPLAAALLLASGASVVLGGTTAVALVATGLPATGAMAFGLSWAVAGIVFAALAAVAAQVTTGSRAATGLTVLSVGLAYVVRAIGDTAGAGPGLVAWFSPIGWVQQVRPFAGDRFALLVPPLAVAILLAGLAFALRARRDLGAGMLTERPGPSVGGLATTWSLAVRLDRGVLVAWAAGIVLFGAIIGSLTTSVSNMIDSPAMKDFFVTLGGEQAIVDAFISAELAILGSMVAAYGISTVIHLRTEEVSGHAEMILARTPSRSPWATSHLAFALGGVAVLMALAGVAVAVGHALDAGNVDMAGEIVLAALARIPAAWVLTALGMCLFGWVPRATSFTWAVFVALVVMVELGALWNLPGWVLDLSPFAHSPKLPGSSPIAVPLVSMTLVTIALAGLGYVGFRRRDLRG